MNTDLIAQKLDLTPNQATVYVTLLQLGSATVQTVATKSRIKRTTAYGVLDTLIQRGLITMVQKGAHRHYFAENPKKLPQVLEGEVERIRHRQKGIDEVLPELSSIFNADAQKPSIRYYEGIEGIKQIFEETLDLGKGEEILAYSSAHSIHEYLQDYVEVYLQKRVEKGIVQRAIAEDSPAARIHKEHDAKELRQTYLVDMKKYPFSNEINIFRNKVCIISYADLLGVVLESTSIANTQRAVFELAWIGSSTVSAS